MSDTVSDILDGPPGPLLAAHLATLDPATLPAENAVRVLKAWSRQRAHDHAHLSATIARVAALSRAATRADGFDPVGADGAGLEIAAALTWTDGKAAAEIDFAEILLRLPGVHAAFAAGRIDHGKAWVFVDVLGGADLTDPQLAVVCGRLLPPASGWTAGQLRARLVRAVLAVDPDWAARRYRRALSRSAVHGYLAADGSATITATGLPVEEAAAACARVDALADTLRRHGHPGPINRIRIRVFCALLDGRLTGLTHTEIIATLLGGHATTSGTPAAEGDAGAQGAPAADAAGEPAAPADAGAGGAGDGGVAGDTARAADRGGDPGARGHLDGEDDVDGVDDRTERDPRSTESDGGPGDGDDGDGDGLGPRPGPGPRFGSTPAARPDPAPAAQSDPAPAGVEIRAGLAALLGLDHRPAEIPGWGPVPVEVAHRLLARQTSGEWRYALLDQTGHLALGGLIPRPLRPPPAHPDAPAAAGGIVEIHLPVTLLDALDPAEHPGWAPILQHLRRRWADRARLWAAVDAHPDTRLVRGTLARHLALRDRTCTAPGCRRPAAACQYDHTDDHHTGGATVRRNTGPLCWTHHAIKHHTGWWLAQPRPGWFRWVSPLGQVYDTCGEPHAPPLPDPIAGPAGEVGPEAEPGGPVLFEGPTWNPTPPPPQRPVPPAPRAGHARSLWDLPLTSGHDPPPF